MKTMANKVVVVGLGEVGKPLYELVSEHYDTIGVDISPVSPVAPVDVLHVCYPFQIKDFIAETAAYIELYRPAVTIINSTVGVGTTRAIAKCTGAAVVNSPVRGKHSRMLEGLRSYTKFIGATNAGAAELAARHFQSVGLKTKTLSSPEASELAKLTETTYFGLMIAWAQEVERYCDRARLNYEEVILFYKEIAFFPPVDYFPGIIGGHCVMPNIEILRQFEQSVILEAIRTSNQIKIAREAQSREEVGAVAIAIP
jgi:UDP-N-acetyl-D-mannosaminuronate dehydrogenase